MTVIKDTKESKDLETRRRLKALFHVGRDPCAERLKTSQDRNKGLCNSKRAKNLMYLKTFKDHKTWSLATWGREI